MSPNASPDVSDPPVAWRDAIRAGDRRALARAITLIESTRPDRAALGQQVLDALVPHTGNAQRVGVTGPPGVGKSSVIETLGLQLIERGHRVAVLAVDPSSPFSGGAVLGNGTRPPMRLRHPWPMSSARAMRLHQPCTRRACRGLTGDAVATVFRTETWFQLW